MPSPNSDAEYPIFQPLRSSAGWTRLSLRVIFGGLGWVLFFYWWSIVVRTTSLDFVERAAMYMMALVLAVTLTAGAWIAHNLKIHRRGKRGTITPYRSPAFATDHLGRPLVLRNIAPGEQWVELSVRGPNKVYDSRSGVFARHAAGD